MVVEEVDRAALNMEKKVHKMLCKHEKEEEGDYTPTPCCLPCRVYLVYSRVGI